jgi:nucleoside-diphosphate-sugar epimerase
MGKTVGIIGCGWLGQALASALVASGVRVIGTTRSPEKAVDLDRLGVEPLVVRFSSEAGGDVERLRRADEIIVAIPPARDVDPATQADAVARTISVTDAAHVIQISTTSVYPSEGMRVVEADATREHPLSRAEGAYSGLDRVVTILRCAGLFGPGRLILPQVLRMGVEVAEDTPTNLVVQADVVRAVLTAMEHPVSDVYNVCSGEHPTKGAFYREIARRAGLDEPRFRSGTDAHKIVDNQKFIERFGFRYLFPDPLEFPV